MLMVNDITHWYTVCM